MFVFGSCTLVPGVGGGWGVGMVTVMARGWVAGAQRKGGELSQDPKAGRDANTGARIRAGINNDSWIKERS